ncbi:unnamed protein product [Rhizophagus irregularis]|nr:unnamed protein product [Rhizophagus irregularis]
MSDTTAITEFSSYSNFPSVADNVTVDVPHDSGGKQLTASINLSKAGAKIARPRCTSNYFIDGGVNLPINVPISRLLMQKCKC